MVTVVSVYHLRLEVHTKNRMLRECRKPCFEESRRKNVIKMKKILFLFSILLLVTSMFAQSNSNNPFDYVGSLHNSVIDYYINENSDPSPTSPNIKQNIVNYFSGNRNSNLNELFDAGASYYSEIANASDKLAVYRKYGFSNSFCNYTNDLNNLYVTKTDNNTFYNSMISKESQISGDNNLSQREKEILLSASSTIRYSNFYWTNDNNTIKWPQPPGTEAQKRGFWSTVGGQDLNGAIQGGVAGAIVGGVVTMGTATVPAYVAGAVSWGAGCSVAAAIGWLTNWW